MSEAVATEWTTDRALIDDAIGAAFRAHRHRMATPVADAVGYALAGGGKRIRGLLVLFAYRACGGRLDAAPLAAAVEIVHAYSLVHDDLPCMDDDDLRRGRPTVHKVHGAAAATVAGVAMVPLAARAGLDAAHGLGLDDAAATEIVRALMRASGASGMVGGQLMDLLGEGQGLSLQQLEQLHRGKTGALIAASAQVGGLAAGAAPDAVDALTHFGHAVGLAFQVVDDILDLTASSDVLGKTAGKDAVAAKSTYPQLLGLAGAEEAARSLVRNGCDGLRRTGLLTPDLDAVARMVLTRRS
jgi:geranylgeranyl diphosphate synthase, type II